MTLSLDLVHTIEEVVAGRLPGAVTATGTVVTRSKVSTDPWLTVAFDGPPNAVPVRAFGHTLARPGDRVGLVRFGSDWVVAGTYTPAWPEEQGVLAAATSGNTTSGSYGPMPGGVSWPFSKAWDDTRVRLDVAIGCRTDVAETAVAFGIQIGGTTYNVAFHVFSSASHRHVVAGFDPGASGIPAGDYTATLQWQQPLGAGTIFIDSSDWISTSTREIGP